MRLAGPVTAELHTRASGSDQADWVCTLCMRRPDGALLNLCEGLARSDSHALTVTVDLGDVFVALDPEPSWC